MMHTRAIALGAVILAAWAWSATAQLRLQDHGSGSGETARQIYDERFSVQNALTRVQQIDKALDSFARLTKLAGPKLTKAQMRRIGNTAPDVQELGFHNWVGAVEGTLRKQNYQIAQLQLDLATAQHKSGKLSEKALQGKQAACRRAAEDFQRFWASFGIAD